MYSYLSLEVTVFCVFQVILFCAYWLLGNMAAFAMSLAFELPFIDLEKIIFSGQRT